MDKFEKILRDKLQHHEAAMPNGAWEQFSQRLDGAVPKPSPWKTYLAGGLAAATIGIGAYFLIPSAGVEKQPVADNTITAQTENNPPVLTDNNTETGVRENTQITENDGAETIVNGSDKTTPAEITPNNTADIKTEVKTLNKDNNNRNTSQDTPVKNNDKKTLNNTPVNNNDSKGNENHVVQNNTGTATIQLPEPEISGNQREVCQNTEVLFKNTGNHSDVEATWLLNGEEVATGGEFRATFSKTGTQTIQLVYSAMQNNKRIVKESEKRFINVLPAPSADIQVDKVNDYSPEYIFRSYGMEDGDYIWNFGDGKVQTGNGITHTYRKKGGYDIVLTVTAANGCKARKTETVEIDNDYNLLAPNSFTPNGDGLNDVFIPEALKAMSDVRFRMLIFDKSGKKIFETTRLDNPWDGRNANTGANCAPDAYVWRVELTRPDGTSEDYIGSITILDK